MGGNMSKKNKKSKIVKLSDEDYNNYIMSLKDETPVKVAEKNNDPIRRRYD